MKTGSVPGGRAFLDKALRGKQGNIPFAYTAGFLERRPYASSWMRSRKREERPQYRREGEEAADIFA